jgi:hypothetical protein
MRQANQIAQSRGFPNAEALLKSMARRDTELADLAKRTKDRNERHRFEMIRLTNESDAKWIRGQM